MASSLSNLGDNLAEEIPKITCKDWDWFVIYENVKANLIKYKCLSCSKDYSNKFSCNDIIKFILFLKKRIKTTFKFSNNDSNMFVL